MVEATFRNTGQGTYWGYQRYLKVYVPMERVIDNFHLRVGRDTAIASIIEKYIIKEDFLRSSRKIITKELTDREWLLLKALKEAGSKYYALYFKALDENMSWEDFEAQILWRIL